jgi:hypothetical protein
MKIDDKKPAAPAPTPLVRQVPVQTRDFPKTNATNKFSQALRQVQNNDAPANPNMRTVESGDTLIGMVRDQASAQGLDLSPSQQMRMAKQVGLSNGLSNVNRIFPGQKLNMASLQAAFQSAQLEAQNNSASLTTHSSAAATASATTNTNTNLIKAEPSNAVLGQNKVTGEHPILEKTLDRAVARGFIPTQEKATVYEKILDLANTHLFEPDDFARMTLMESDGMNPRASNQRCHGIIQFCDGPARGAATAGYAANPRAILDLSVNQQLDLVGKYFDEVGLKNKGPAGLEDLYLSVLKPAARKQSLTNAPLNIQGTQASHLYVGRNTQAFMTRNSIREGLIQNATERLSQLTNVASTRLQALRAASYGDIEPN